MLKVVCAFMFSLLVVGGLVTAFGAQSSRAVRSKVVSNAFLASVTLPPSLILLGGGTQWAGHNGSSALYVDWKDNWVAHHETDGVDWGPWPLESDMDDMRFSAAYVLEKFGFNVQFAGDMPESLSGYDVVVIHAYWTVEPRHEALIREYVSNGGGVVLLSGVPEFLRCYCKDWWTYRCGSDFSSLNMSQWLGADYYVNTGGYANLTVDNPFGTLLQANDTLIEGSGYSNAAEGGLHNDSQIIALWWTGPVFAFTHEFGAGRVYYQATFENVPSVKIERLSMTPATPSYDDDVVVSATIKDGLGVDRTFLGYEVDGTWQNVSMNRNGDDFDAIVPSQEYGTLVEYKIYANDTNGRWVTSSTYSYTVVDLIPPEIGTVEWQPVDSSPNGTVRVTVNITEPADASGVKEAIFSYKDSFGQWWNETMAYNSATSLYEVFVPAQPHNTTVQFYITAWDNAGNMATSENHEYIVMPEYQALLIAPLSILAVVFAVVLRKRERSIWNATTAGARQTVTY